ncbi:hypothetical protein [Herpetosiphon gulosus]|uniref:Uncharacterized protein n=1 Tax=Herpetosiphon gulosus TaxID=1973496 RepID=A0ABP9XA71_9CHLR
MTSFKLSCPECGAYFEAALPTVRFGGSANPNHSYVQADEYFSCATCHEQLEISVRRDIQTGLISSIAGTAKAAVLRTWQCQRCHFSPNGQQLAIDCNGQLRVFERLEDLWIPSHSSPTKRYNLIGWLGEQLLLTDGAIWDLANNHMLWQHYRPMLFVKETAFDPQQQLVIRGLATGNSPYSQMLEAHHLDTDEQIMAEIGILRNYNDHVVCWNIKQNIGLCARSNQLELWHYDQANRNFIKIMSNRLERGAVRQAWWLANGTILAVIWYQNIKAIASQSDAYGLIQFDGTTLEVLREQVWVGPTVIGTEIRFKSASLAANNDLLWHANRLSLIDGTTWEVREILPYKPEFRETVAINPDASSYAIGRSNDAVVVDRATNRAWSLRREREIRLLNRD